MVERFRTMCMNFFISSQELLEGKEGFAWSSQADLLRVVRHDNLFIESQTAAKAVLTSIVEVAIQTLVPGTSGKPEDSLSRIALIFPSEHKAPAILLSLSELVQTDYDLVLPSIPRIISRLLHVRNFNTLLDTGLNPFAASARQQGSNHFPSTFPRLPHENANAGRPSREDVICFLPSTRWVQLVQHLSACHVRFPSANAASPTSGLRHPHTSYSGTVHTCCPPHSLQDQGVLAAVSHRLQSRGWGSTTETRSKLGHPLRCSRSHGICRPLLPTFALAPELRSGRVATGNYRFQSGDAAQIHQFLPQVLEEARQVARRDCHRCIVAFGLHDQCRPSIGPPLRL